MNNVFWKTQLPFDPHFKEMLSTANFYDQYRFPMIVRGQRCNVLSSFRNLKRTAAEDELSMYCNNLYDMAIGDFFKRLGVYNHIRYKYYYWWQIYEHDVEEAVHPQHSHYDTDGTVFCFVHFIRTNNEHCFRFAGPYNESDESVKEKDNDIIFFHPLLLHQALRPSNGTRIVIAGNIRITENELSTY